MHTKHYCPLEFSVFRLADCYIWPRLAGPNSMLREASISDANEWSERSEYWRVYREPSKRGRPKKFKYREPLILCGHGARIRVDHNSLLVRNGFTHYPQKQDEYRFF